ncbi:hypothetical protein PYCCODRAFT_840917 [Trametes coccinea BRFM310]|uniref:Uncharacterized protein n=1 Tax=Trametes coccinea (strain BRFM310) TaxID=1353009 RepID=A0A1Y2IE14_TRAC3|nr:hypothetical protein PYCCODRAFT_840917 [Trametes coccinea BRFM310]
MAGYASLTLLTTRAHAKYGDRSTIGCTHAVRWASHLEPRLMNRGLECSLTSDSAVECKGPERLVCLRQDVYPTQENEHTCPAPITLPAVYSTLHSKRQPVVDCGEIGLSNNCSSEAHLLFPEQLDRVACITVTDIAEQFLSKSPSTRSLVKVTTRRLRHEDCNCLSGQ